MSQQQIREIARVALDSCLQDKVWPRAFFWGMAAGLGLASGVLKSLPKGSESRAVLIAIADELDRREEEQVRIE